MLLTLLQSIHCSGMHVHGSVLTVWSVSRRQRLCCKMEWGYALCCTRKAFDPTKWVKEWILLILSKWFIFTLKELSEFIVQWGWWMGCIDTAMWYMPYMCKYTKFIFYELRRVSICLYLFAKIKIINFMSSWPINFAILPMNLIISYIFVASVPGLTKYVLCERVELGNNLKLVYTVVGRVGR